MNEIIVNCGDTSAHPDAERAYRAIRVEQGDTAPAGCGKPVGLIHLYRCTDCARWMHHSCLVRHFVDHGDETRARVARLEAAVLRMEWDEQTDVKQCSWCMGWKEHGHHDGCEMAALVNAALAAPTEATP